jgi:WD40 repeat protein
VNRLIVCFLLLALVNTGTFPVGAQASGKLIPIAAKNADQVTQVALLGGEGTKHVDSLAFSPDGKLLAFGRDNTVQLWDMENGHSKAILTGPKDKYHVTCIAFSPDGKLLAYGSFDPVGDTGNKIWLWDIENGHPKAPLPSTVQGMAFSPNGKLLAVAYGIVRLWDMRTGKLKATLQNRDYEVWINSVAFSPDGSLLAGASKLHNTARGNTIQLWSVKSGKLIANLYHNIAFVDGDTVAFSPDGSLLASGSDSPMYGFTVHLWDVKTYRLKTTLQTKYETGIRSLAFSPDGSLLAEGGWERVVRLWDVKSGNLIVTLQGHIDRVNSIAFSPDGTLLASGGADGTLRLWGIPTDQIFGTAH